MSAVPVESFEEAARRLAADAIRSGMHLVGLHCYTHADGVPMFWRIRCKHPRTGEKWIRPMHWNGTGYVIGELPAPAAGKLLYRLDDLGRAAVGAIVYVVEGESCADALTKLDLLATTSGSASSADGADWSPLRGRRVRLWPDNDDSGRKYADDVECRLRALGCAVECIDVDALGLAEKGDCVDWLAARPDADAVAVNALPLAETARAGGSAQHFAPVPLPDPLPAVPVFNPALLPDCIRTWCTDAADSLQVPLDFTAVPAMVGLAAALGGRHLAVRLRRHGHWYERPILWGCVIGRPSSGKSPALSPARRLLESVTGPESDEYERARKVHEGKAILADTRKAQAKEEARKAIKKGMPIDPEALGESARFDDEAPTEPRLVVNDATVEKLGELLNENPRGLIQFRDELAGWLASCVYRVFAVYVLLRCAMYRTLWRTTEEQLVYGAKQQTVLMESVRGVQAIKLANKQADRSARLANATLEMVGCDVVVQRIALSFGVVNQCLFGLLRASLIALGAYLTMQGRFSAGMVVAFVAYADQFSAKMGGLVDKLVELRMLRLHGERIADIALALPERSTATARSGGRIVRPNLSIRGVCFRYAEGEPLVLNEVELEVEAGASLCIVGASGCGKSTLAKVMLGLLEPTSGRVEINGVDIRHHGLNAYRSLIGTVMQDDALFAGSIADNISFFEEVAHLEDIVAAARLAQIDGEIDAMPMGYESFVGDMGSSLSGGQKQRILLARALYKKPQILVLDEATSHLDMDCERRINSEIARLDITKIIIAHRPDTIASADRVVVLRGGCVISDRLGEGGLKLEAVRHRPTEISG